MKFIGCLLLAGLLSSCAKDETLPPTVSSAGLTMDGTHFIPFSGAPDEFGETKHIDALRVPGGWSTPPVPLPGGGFAVGSNNGSVFIFNDQDSVTRSFDFGEAGSIDQLLIDSSSIYAVIANRMVCAADTNGHIRWKARMDSLITAPAMLAGNQMIIPCLGDLLALSTTSGTVGWKYKSANEVSSIALNDANHQIVAATTGNDFDKDDTIVILSSEGKLLRMFPIAGRITSNIALCGDEMDRIAFGAARGSGNGKKILAELYDATTGKKLQEHSIPYFANSIGANRKSYFTSGFRTTGGESISGIDAFSLEDTARLWSRRFTEPVTSPVAVGNGSIYFSLTFETDAIVGSKGLFYTLDAASGKTVSERAIVGAVSGFVPGMPMPDRAGRLLLADRVRPVIYLLSRSAFRRIF